MNVSASSIDFLKEFIYFNLLRQKLSIFLGEALDHLAIVLLVYALVCLILYKLIFHRFGGYLIKKYSLPVCKRVLLVTAHPDDESMFFGPTILALRKNSCRLFVLCLSNGNFDKNGKSRRKELWSACKYLKIMAGDITLMNSTHLQDDPNLEWKTVTIATQILKLIETLDIDLLITFDKDGVSQHPNHCAIYYATASLCLSGLIPNNCKVLTLETINLCRKYLSLFDLPITLLLSTNWSILTWKDRKIVQTAMKKHESQMVWFRKLYIIFSRYMIINSLREITQSDVEFEILDT